MARRRSTRKPYGEGDLRGEDDRDFWRLAVGDGERDLVGDRVPLCVAKLLCAAW